MFSLIRRFPSVALTIAVAAVAGVLLLVPWQTPWGSASNVVIAVYVLAMAARSAWSMLVKIRHGAFGVDIIAVTAIVSAVLVGEYWAALVVVLMLTSGQALETYAATRAQRDLTALLERRPIIAHRLAAGTTEAEDVDVDDLQPGDRVIVRTGEVVPVDGALISPAGTFDESSLTGESMPVDRVAGDAVMSGAVNGSSAIQLTVERVASDSQYQQIIALVEGAAQSKAPIVRLADRFALPFALVAYSIAGLAWSVSGDPVRFAEVLVVATPCPLIIAAPVSFMAGMSRAAREGIIIRTSATLEKLFRTRNVAFDKTGTLTRGEPTLVDIRPADKIDPTDLLRWAAAVETNSSHTLATATVTGAHTAGVVVPASANAHEITAHGVTATVEGRVVAVGKRSFIADQVSAESPEAQVARTALAPGEMGIYVAVADRYAGALVFRDEVRAESARMLQALKALGVRKTMMLTGDDEQTARHVAAELGIDDVHANCLPGDKVAVVAAATPRPVVMVGDGINDAPVLAVADVGVAMGARGATAASEAADVVILRDDVGRVATAVAVGRETVGVALQSIWIGLGLSVVLMVLAAFGLIPAIVGAWLQEGVDVIVILWALRATR